jgi:hypothetical protein
MGKFYPTEQVSELEAEQAAKVLESSQSVREKILADAGIDTATLKGKIAVLAENIKRRIKPGANAELVSASIKDAVVKLAVETKTKDGAMTMSIALTFGCFVFSSLAISIFSMALGPVAGLTLASVTVGPLVEEMAKREAARLEISGTFFVVFNIVEYSINVIPNIAKAPIKVLTRIPPVLMHLVTTIIHNKSRIEADGNGMDETKVALTKGILVHAAWNSLGGITRIMS